MKNKNRETRKKKKTKIIFYFTRELVVYCTPLGAKGVCSDSESLFLIQNINHMQMQARKQASRQADKHCKASPLCLTECVSNCFFNYLVAQASNSVE